MLRSYTTEVVFNYKLEPIYILDIKKNVMSFGDCSKYLTMFLPPILIIVKWSWLKYFSLDLHFMKQLKRSRKETIKKSMSFSL